MNKKNKIIIVFIVFTLIISGCAFLQSEQKYEVAQETVLIPGMKLCATDKNFRICIVAGLNNKRTIIFDGKERTFDLVPRKTRWYGVLGLVSPQHPYDLFEDAEGITMANIYEAQLHYVSKDAVLKSLRDPYKNQDAHVAYRDDGLLIRWKKTKMPDRQNIFSLAVYQILINGEKPDSLPGSRNKDICVSYGGEDACQ